MTQSLPGTPSIPSSAPPALTPALSQREKGRVRGRRFGGITSPRRPPLWTLK
jgi:hypothetical protein